MPRKCCVGDCNSNYDTEEETVTTHGFPPDPDEQQRWIDALPNILTERITKNTAVCIKHWPPNYETRPKKGHLVPVNPPSVFSLPTSFLRQTTTPVPRKVQSRNVLTNFDIVAWK